MWRLIFPALSFVLIAAHAMFHGMPELIAIPAALIVLLAVPHWLIPKVEMFSLILCGGEWIRSGVELVMMRLTWGQPWHLAACIMAGVAVFTWLSCLVFYSARLANYYGSGCRCDKMH